MELGGQPRPIGEDILKPVQREADPHGDVIEEIGSQAAAASDRAGARRRVIHDGLPLGDQRRLVPVRQPVHVVEQHEA